MLRIEGAAGTSAMVWTQRGRRKYDMMAVAIADFESTSGSARIYTKIPTITAISYRR